jgi:hypothetical protein
VPAPTRSGPLSLALVLFVLAATLLTGMLASVLPPADDKPPIAPPALSMARPGPRIDATADAEARRMRSATRQLANELSAAARCDARQAPHRFSLCVIPALRHAGIGGRTTAMLIRGITAAIPTGRCRNYLFGLQAANDASADNARGLLPVLYQAQPRHRHRRMVTQLALNARMLHRALRAAPANTCSPTGSELAT